MIPCVRLPFNVMLLKYKSLKVYGGVEVSNIGYYNRLYLNGTATGITLKLFIIPVLKAYNLRPNYMEQIPS
jgi:hypothetical protein